jgi:hypothetical protein
MEERLALDLGEVKRGDPAVRERCETPADVPPHAAVPDGPVAQDTTALTGKTPHASVREALGESGAGGRRVSVVTGISHLSAPPRVACNAGTILPQSATADAEAKMLGEHDNVQSAKSRLAGIALC